MTPATDLVTINTTTGVGSLVGSLGYGFSDAGMAFASDGTLYGATDLDHQGFYSINTTTGAATLVGNSASDAHALAYYNNQMYGILDASNGLYAIDVTTGVGSLIGNLGIGTDEDGFIIDSAGNGYLLQDNVGGGIYSVDLTTGLASSFVAYSGTTCRFESAALNPVPEPASLVLFGLGLAGFSLSRRKKSA